MSSRNVTVEIPSRPYESEDNCLAAAEADIAERYELQGWDLSPRWGNGQRTTILLDIPADAAREVAERPGCYVLSARDDE